MKDRFVFRAFREAKMIYFYIFLVLAGGAIIAWQIKCIAQKARQLDERIDEYHEEGPPKDPYGELARIMMEDQKTKRYPRSRKLHRPAEREDS